MRSEFNGVEGPVLAVLQPRAQKQARPGPGERASKPKSRLTRSRVAKPLLTSLGTITLLLGSTFVVVATSSTGSLNPSDWRQANLSGASSRFQFCGKQGVGAIGCMLSTGFASASATTAPANKAKAQPLIVTATMQDMQPPAGSSAAGPAKAGSRPSGAHGGGSWTKGSLVHLPSNATRMDVLAGCQTAMKTAISQGAAAVQEVVDECRDDYSSTCKLQMRTPTTQGMTAIKEMDDECSAYQRQGSPSPPSSWPDD